MNRRLEVPLEKRVALENPRVKRQGKGHLLRPIVVSATVLVFLSGKIPLYQLIAASAIHPAGRHHMPWTFRKRAAWEMRHVECTLRG